MRASAYLDVRIFASSVERRARLSGEVAMPEDASFRVQGLEVAQQRAQRFLLCLRPGVFGMLHVYSHAADVADADGAFIVASAMSAGQFR